MARETSVIEVIKENVVGVAEYSVRHLEGL
jgi:hypothetical protein